MSANQPDLAKFQQAVANALHTHWKLYLVEGIVLLALGFIAIVIPPIATLAVTILLGWLFFVSGVVGIFTSFWMRQAPGFWWSLLSAVLGIVVGVSLLAMPLSGALSLTVVLIAFFIIEGVTTILFASEHRQELSGQWGWMLASGLGDRASGRHQYDIRRLGADRHGPARQERAIIIAAARRLLRQL